MSSLSIVNHRPIIKKFQEDQLNSSKFPVFPEEILNSSRFPVFPGLPKVADTLLKNTLQMKQQNKIWWTQMEKVMMTWEKDVFSGDAWKCGVSQTWWHWMAKCSRNAVYGTTNERSPIIVRHDDGVIRTDVDADRNLFLESMSATWCSSFMRYGGAIPCMHRKTSTRSNIKRKRKKSLNIHSTVKTCWYHHALL